MKKYVAFLMIAVLAAAVLTGCKGESNILPRIAAALTGRKDKSNAPPRKHKGDSLTVHCVTLEFAFKEIVESEEGGGALEEKILRMMVQRVSLGEEFEIHNEKTVHYIEEVEGIEVPVAGTKMISVNGKTKILGETRKFLLNTEIRYIDEQDEINFSAKPSLTVSMDSDEELVITKSGPIVITLRVTLPDEVTYDK